MRLEVTFSVLHLCNTHNSGNIAYLTTVCLHLNWKAHSACDLKIIVNVEGLLKVAGSHIHWKSGNVLETVLDIDVVTAGH